MTHIIEIVVEWAIFGLLVGVPAAIVGFAVRTASRQTWTTEHILEAATGIGAVMGFVLMVFIELLV